MTTRGKIKIKAYKNGFVWFEKLQLSGKYSVSWFKNTEIQDLNTKIQDKVLCDDYRSALDYYRSFCAIAKSA